MSIITECKHCGAVIDTELGAFGPAEHADALGTDDDPRAPGDWDDVCAPCGYGEPGAFPPPKIERMD